MRRICLLLPLVAMAVLTVGAAAWAEWDPILEMDVMPMPQPFMPPAGFDTLDPLGGFNLPPMPEPAEHHAGDAEEHVGGRRPRLAREKI